MLKKTPETERQVATEVETERDDPLFCKRCGHLITRERWAVSRNGDHLHTVFNPAGHLFRVRCFEHAPGVGEAGEPTDNFTWFPGFFWRFSLCRGCGDHLGWAYSGTDGGTAFYGLIATKLVANRD